MQNDSGWIKVHRKMRKNPVVCKDSDHIAVWLFLLLGATHNEQTATFRGKNITLLPGQLVTTQKEISDEFDIEPSKVKRVLKLFENDNLIDKQTDMHKSLITIRNWGVYQGENDKPNDNQVTNQARKKDEKEKRNKKEKEENKESSKNGRSSNARACEDNNDNVITDSFEYYVIGKHQNITVSLDWLAEFKNNCRYATDIIEAFSRYKRDTNIMVSNDAELLEQAAQVNENWKDSTLADGCFDVLIGESILSTEIHLFGWKDSKVLMMSDAQFDSICETCSFDEIDYYMDRMVDLVSKGYKFACSHYDYIMQMVDKDRKVRKR